jgi:mRNA-capping enzyme
LLLGAKIAIEEELALHWLDTVIECTWNKEQQTWKFLRDRKDKETPNAYHVYEKVMKSIDDNINEEVLLEAVDQALKNTIYDKDRKAS